MAKARTAKNPSCLYCSSRCYDEEFGALLEGSELCGIWDSGSGPCIRSSSSSLTSECVPRYSLTVGFPPLCLRFDTSCALPASWLLALACAVSFFLDERPVAVARLMAVLSICHVSVPFEALFAGIRIHSV